MWQRPLFQYTRIYVCPAAGIWGVLVARDLNLCDRSNGTQECVIETSLNSALEPMEDAEPSEHAYRSSARASPLFISNRLA